jgi:lysophospholipase L1-like esterase
MKKLNPSDGLHPRRLGGWLGRASFSILLLVVLAEITLRLAGLITVTMRARQVENDLASLPSAVRLLHIGESTTFGLGVKPDEAYPAVLARLLEERYPARRFVALNRGVPGLTTTAMLRTLPGKLQAVRPDLVTIMAGANDYNDQLNGLRPAEETWLPPPISGLRVYKMIRLAVELARSDVKRENGEVLFYRHGASKNILYEEPRDAEKIARVTKDLRANLAEMIRVCRRHGVPVVLVGYIQAIEENAVLSAVAAEEGIPYVPTFVHLHERPPALFGEDGWHPSPIGHRHIAGKIDDALALLWGDESMARTGATHRAARP